MTVYRAERYLVGGQLTHGGEEETHYDPIAAEVTQVWDYAHTRLIWRVRGTLGPQGHLLLANAGRNPAEDSDLRRQLVDAIVARARAAVQPWADDRGLLAHAKGQLVHEPCGDVCSWDTVWALISPGITPERVAELNAAWSEGADGRAAHGDHTDMRLHMACCAFYDPPAAPAPPEQLDLFDLFDLIGQTA